MFGSSPFLSTDSTDATANKSAGDEDDDDVSLPFDFPSESESKKDAKAEGQQVQETGAGNEDMMKTEEDTQAEHAKSNNNQAKPESDETDASSEELVRPPDDLESDVNERLKQMEEEDPLKDIQSSSIEVINSCCAFSEARGEPDCTCWRKG